MKEKSLGEIRQAIEELMEYAVPSGRRREADEIVARYAGDPVGLALLYAFYSILPEAVDDGVRELRLLARRQGSFLLRAATFLDAEYVYAATSEGAELLGRAADEEWDPEIIDFFGFGDPQQFLELLREGDQSPVYEPSQAVEGLCPLCQAASGEYHTLGCPVEICPWCGGQLTYCNCRFVQLGVESIDDEHQLEVLLERLEAAGRIPFAESQRPAYPE